VRDFFGGGGGRLRGGRGKERNGGLVFWGGFWGGGGGGVERVKGLKGRVSERSVGWVFCYLWGFGLWFFAVRNFSNKDDKQWNTARGL